MHWIGGQWLNSGEHRESINPATGEVIGSYAKGGRKEAELAGGAVDDLGGLGERGGAFREAAAVDQHEAVAAPSHEALRDDALEEAGCDHPDVLTHCRRPGPHARGCWVVDAARGK